MLIIQKKKKKKYLNFFQFNNYLFSDGTTTTNKLDDRIPVAHF